MPLWGATNGYDQEEGGSRPRGQHGSAFYLIDVFFFLEVRDEDIWRFVCWFCSQLFVLISDIRQIEKNRKRNKSPARPQKIQ